MPARPSPSAVYRSRAQQLRAVGFKIRYSNGKKGTTSAAHKTAVTKGWNKIKNYVAGTKQKFKFIPLEKPARRTAKKSALASKQFTPAGVFVHVPKGISPGKYKIRFGADGVIHAKIKGRRGGVRREEVHRLDPVKLADDPSAAIESLLGDKKPQVVRLTVNGHDAKIERPWHAFLHYFPERFERIANPADDEGHGEDGMTAEEFADIFQVKFIYQEETPASTKGKKHVKKTKKPKSRRR